MQDEKPRRFHNDGLPWVRDVALSYKKRMRVLNFSTLGKRMFGEIVYRAVLGESVIFAYDSNIDAPIPVENMQGSDFDFLLGDNNFRSVGFDGIMYDEEGSPILEYNGMEVRCLKLSQPPVSPAAERYAARAFSIDGLIDDALPRLTVPETWLTGTSPKVQLKKAQERDPNMTIKVDANTDSDQVVTPQVKNLSQWNNDELITLQKQTAFQFLTETNIPPQDLSSLDTLGVATQSLIAHREPFVSRVTALKTEFAAVFESLESLKPYESVTQVSVSQATGEETTESSEGSSSLDSTPDVPDENTNDTKLAVPGVTMKTVRKSVKTLVYDSLFPYSPQDIASLGDAFGKGLNQDVVNQFNLS